EHVAVQLAGLGILHRDLRSLRQACQQLVRRMGCEHHRVLAARTVLANGVHVLVVLVERRMWNPRFVKMQGVDLGTQLFLDHFDVVADAVVSTLRDGKNAGLLVLDAVLEGMSLDFGTYAFGLELLKRYGADDAKVVSCRPQEDGDG